ncbi:unnamed protein product [Rhizophagus irregularis]|nr:unnamed protein product [Rhizophagus irregularis]
MSGKIRQYITDISQFHDLITVILAKFLENVDGRITTLTCKYYDSEESPRFNNELAMLQLLNNSDNIIKFLGLSDFDEGRSSINF